LTVVLGVISALLSLLPLPHEWRVVIVPCWILLAVQALFELCCEYARASIRPWHYMGMQIARSGAAILLGVGLIRMGMGWSGPLLGLAGGMAIAVAYAYRADWMDVRPRIDRDTFIKVCQYGLPLSLTVALTVVISTSDRFLIAWFHGEDAAGLYSVAVDFTSQTLTLLLMVINMAMFPLAVRAFEQEGREAAQEQMRSNASLLLAAGVPCVVGMTVLAPGIAHCFIGKSFREAAVGIMPLIALGTLLAGLKAYHFDAAFQFAHRTIYQVWIVLFAAVVNLALNLVAVPRWGIQGAAVASLIAYVISIVLTAWLGRRHFTLPFPVATSLQVILAGLVMGAVLVPFRSFLSPVAVAAQIAAGAVVYALILIGGFNFLGIRDSITRNLRMQSPEYQT
jgi:O-antigen/teichoic acid export membrane protein